MISKRVSFLSFSLCTILLVTGRGAEVSPALDAPVPALVGSELSGRKDKTGSVVDAGEFYRVGERKIRLLRSLKKVAVRHAPGQGQAIRRRLEESIPPMLKRFKVDRELPKERMLVLQTADVSTWDQLRETMDQLRLEAGTDQVVPVYINEESGLEMIATEQFVVKLAAEATMKDLEAINDLMGVVMVRALRGATDQFILSIPGGTAEELLDAVEFYGADPAIEWASPNFLCQVVQYATPNDSYYSRQWHLNNTGQSGGKDDADIDAPEAWDVTTGSSQITIAIVDNGMDLGHEDLRENLPSNPDEIAGDGVDNDHNGYVDDRNGWDFVNNDKDPSHAGSNRHGTLVAGVAAARGNNNKGVAGVAYGCRLMPVKFNEDGKDLWIADMAEAIRYAAGIDSSGRHAWRGADVINISGGFSEEPVLFSALHDAAVNGRNGKGCAIFCASGNEANDGWQLIPLRGFSSSTYTFRWEYKKDTSGTQGDDAVWLDSVEFPGGEQETFANGLPSDWRTGGSGNAKWFSVQEGQGGNHARTGTEGQSSRAFRSGKVGDNGYSYIEVTKTVRAGTLFFWCWASCERGYDGLRLYINGQPQYEGKLVASGVPESRTAVAYPASHPDTIAVGSSTDFDYRADHSCYGAELDFLAPGGGGSMDIWTTVPMGRGDADGDGNADGNYEPVQGTSFASPLAAGVAALMLSKNPNLTAQQVRNIMRSTCDKVDTVPYPDGRNDYYGYGRINAKKALDATESIAVPKSLPADLEVVASALYPSTTTTGLAPGSKEAQERQKQAVQQLKLPLEVKTRKTGIVFRLVPNGTFTITRDWGLIDIPAVVKWQVTLTKAFYCGKFEITGSQWRQVMLNDLPYVGLDTPARSVSWDECQAFVKKLCQIEGVADETYRLLTEAEWEYACLAGTQGSFYFASGPDGYDYDDLAANKVCCRYHYGAPSYMDRTLCFVGSFPPNAWGLHDTHGSVSEWCQDDLDGWMTDDPGGSVTDPFGTLGDARVLRGGSVHDEIRQCAVEATIRAPASMWSGGWGLRLARTAPSNP